MAQALHAQQNPTAKKKVAIGLWAVFIAYFLSYFFMNGVNIAQPKMVEEFNGMALFAWLIALHALGSAVTTLLFGKLSDMYGRRSILLVSLGLFFVGAILSVLSTSMAFAIMARVVLALGQGTIAPLCFSVIGDIFAPTERAKWSGMLNLPAGIAATIAPTLGGIITDSSMGWRGLFWICVPIVLVSGGLVAAGMPGRTQKVEHQVDFLGIIMIVVASATLIVGVSWLGAPDKLAISTGLVAVSIISWAGFITTEDKAKAPILDPQVLFNRTFITAAGSGFMSLFGLLGVMIYSPIFAQNVMGVSPTISGYMLTPFTMLMAFMGIPAGFLLAKTKKYKWMYIIGYAILTVALFIMWSFTKNTPPWLFVLVTALFGFSNGVMPTINTLVAQFAVPRRLLGVAIGAIFFFVMMGMATAPAILGLAQNSVPDLEAGLKLVFLVGAVTMAISLLMIVTIPEVSMDAEVADKQAAPTEPLLEAAD
ncbi:MAG: MFS transporter [Anaerolineales bacterium]|nr:MFS transporter [Anaerolineales bacterium]